MPRQSTVRENDPNRNNKNKRTRSAFSSLTETSQSAPSQYATETPSLIKNNTTADTLTVGKMYGGPQGESTWTQLSNLLGVGMKAAEVGTSIYKQVSEDNKRKDAEDDAEVLRDMELTWAQEMDTDAYKAAGPAKRLEMQKAHHNLWKGRLKGDEARFRYDMAGMQYELQTDTKNAEQWFSDTVTRRVNGILATPGMSEDEQAEKIAEIYRVASSEVESKFGHDSSIMDALMGKIAGGVQSSEARVETAARQMLQDMRGDITKATNEMIKEIGEGTNLDLSLLEGGEDGERYDVISQEILNRAGIDITVLDPEQQGAVRRELREMIVPLMEGNFELIRAAEDRRVQDHLVTGLKGEMELLANPTGNGLFSANSVDGMLVHLENLDRTGMPPNTLNSHRVTAIKAAVEAGIRRLDYSLGDDERETEVRRIVAQMEDAFGWTTADENNTSVQASRREVATYLETEAAEGGFGVLEALLEDKNDKQIFKIAMETTGPLGDQAFELAVQRMGASMVDYSKAEIMMAMERFMGAPDAMGPRREFFLTDQQRADAGSAVATAFNAAANGEEFVDVLREQLPEDLQQYAEQISDAAYSTESHMFVTMLQEYRDGKRGDRTDMIPQLEELFASLGGSFDDRTGDISGGMLPVTEAEQARLIMSKPSSIKEFSNRLGQGRPIPNESDTAAYGKDVEMFIREAMEQPGIAGALGEFQAGDAATKLADLLQPRYGIRLSPTVLEPVVDLIRQGAFDGEESQLLFDGLGEAVVKQKRKIRDTEIVNRSTWDGNWDDVPLQLRVELVNIAGGTDRPITLEDAKGFLSERGLVADYMRKEDGEVTSARKVVVKVDDTYDGKGLIGATDDGEQEKGVGASMRGMQLNESAKRDLTTYRKDIEVIGEGKPNADDYALVDAALGVILGDRGGSFLYSQKDSDLPAGVDPEDYRKLQRLLKTPRGYNISHGRVALMAALLEDGVPISDWTESAFNNAEQSMSRGLDGSLQFVQGDGTVYNVPDALSGRYGGLSRSSHRTEAEVQFDREEQKRDRWSGGSRSGSPMSQIGRSFREWWNSED